MGKLVIDNRFATCNERVIIKPHSMLFNSNGLFISDLTTLLSSLDLEREHPLHASGPRDTANRNSVRAHSYI